MAPFCYFYIFIFSGMEKNKKALRIQKGIEYSPNVNPDVLSGKGNRKRKQYSVEEYISGILSGDRTILSRAITLTESSLPEHHDTIQTIILCEAAGFNTILVETVGAGQSEITVHSMFDFFLLLKGKVTSYRAAVYLIDKYFKR
jgi:LAO/AO transport system kinase